MNNADFDTAFEMLTGSPPFPWQGELFRRFLEGQIPPSCNLPTGLGKTSVVPIWLLALSKQPEKLPRRLIYIVDRRAVVDQATNVANGLRKTVEQQPDLGAALRLNGRPLPISTLRGQHVDNKQWLEDPSSPAIIVGTIDMIGSRLLFEGYGVSRKMRPYHAGLLGADSLFILDEAHLVPPFEMLLDAIASDSAGVAPREAEARKIVPHFKLMSLSATGRARSEHPFSLTDEDFEHPIVRQRLGAKKRLRLRLLQAEGQPTPSELDDLLADSLAEEAWRIAEHGTKAVRVIVFCNQRKVAEAAKRAVEKLAKAAGHSDIKNRTELFVGGRRVYEREEAGRRLSDLGFIAGTKVTAGKPAFVFATSAGEVGVDLDAEHMVSDLVEWERMIQRLGRVNRRGEGDAQVVVVVPPERPPNKATREALAKPPGDRADKDLKKIAEHEAANQRMRAIQRPFALLSRNEDGTIDASPGSIEKLKRSAEQSQTGSAEHDSHIRAWRNWFLKVASTPEPLRPALTRAVVEAWSMTSLKEHTGRPEVGPWLRGWKEDDPPQTTVVWRKYLPTRSKRRVTAKEIEAFFEAAPPHTSEALETETDAVWGWLQKRAQSLLKQEYQKSCSGPDPAVAIALVLSSAGDLLGWFVLTSNGLEFAPASKRAKQDDEAGKRALRSATLIVDAARLAGLHDGLLDATESDIPRIADDGDQWLDPIDGAPVVRFRIRTLDGETAERAATEPGWRTRFRFATTISEENEPSGWLVVEKWRSDGATEDDRAVGHCQLLEDHQTLAATHARALAVRLNLREPYAGMLAIAARLHDEGKRAKRWQRAFNGPDDGKHYAKTPGPINVALLDGYRHEFSSIAVAAKDTELLQLPKEVQDLALHMIAAHHGHGRPVIGVNGCEEAPPSKLEARAREVALRFARLQRRWGPWGLAWWESLLRAVDHQASRENDATAAGSDQEATK